MTTRLEVWSSAGPEARLRGWLMLSEPPQGAYLECSAWGGGTHRLRVEADASGRVRLISEGLHMRQVRALFGFEEKKR